MEGAAVTMFSCGSDDMVPGKTGSYGGSRQELPEGTIVSWPSESSLWAHPPQSNIGQPPLSIDRQELESPGEETVAGYGWGYEWLTS